MKNEYNKPTIEIINMISEDLLLDSTFDPKGLFNEEADDIWFKK